MKRDGEQKAGFESGTSEKSSFHNESPESLGQGSVGKNQENVPGNKPAPNPSKKVDGGFTIK